MEPQNKEVLLPHHEQQALCTTRLPYRQGRKLTAIKVYTVNNESNHLLIFGIPSLNLRQEAKALFSKFGKLTQFNVSKVHAAEVFTETYHAVFERIQSARMAKRMLDTKNFYGGLLHICYGPEQEDINETRSKLLQRQKDVLSRLRNLRNEADNAVPIVVEKTSDKIETKLIKVNMGEINTINLDENTVKKRKQIRQSKVQEKRYKPCFVNNSVNCDKLNNVNEKKSMLTNSDFRQNDKIEVIDCTSTNLDTVTNINLNLTEDYLENLPIASESNVNDSLNYKQFGNEVIKKVPAKTVNKIQFNINKR